MDKSLNHICRGFIKDKLKKDIIVKCIAWGSIGVSIWNFANWLFAFLTQSQIHSHVWCFLATVFPKTKLSHSVVINLPLHLGDIFLIVFTFQDGLVLMVRVQAIYAFNLGVSLNNPWAMYKEFRHAL